MQVIFVRILTRCGVLGSKWFPATQTHVLLDPGWFVVHQKWCVNLHNMPCPLKVPFQHATVVGKITELLAEHEVSRLGIAVIEEFVVAPTRHEKFGMPYLVQRREDPSFVILHTKVFLPQPTPHVSINQNHSGY